ncbi:Scr1 family TA system antitoxin-like transcriptional regulator [Saccharothrix luteola]|uniref:Scr1 family TA system antitoxin-like transcriptional regulator n=1 Tax=Saccharothrix luteola TaxID=2893018 RepID=UPI0027E23D13|nr:Scr1 family TA system antitoxin-like transcriptional regulator [Saccharothrix luteola]MCC8248759.1 DUF5753 domain-containing protein [Saccharothrix luteola]
MELETDAVAVSDFEIDLIPGLLRTEDYARAVIRAADPGIGGGVLDQRVELRTKRQNRVLVVDLNGSVGAHLRDVAQGGLQRWQPELRRGGALR